MAKLSPEAAASKVERQRVAHKSHARVDNRRLSLTVIEKKTATRLGVFADPTRVKVHHQKTGVVHFHT